ncbi:acetolactate decarboxylase [Maridesulfovibrio hydrothermalis]|uniref:Alpha-acetolactate decarboxylase n=1 Tax=Maridesulfovibrio hydrothermalis AM13 = DSM 14728 TaxID=1121451 RepID=L0R9E7_9BACT|nr:acetolactate decarboxylase [Maridesulfovibrio hydrothermalis]CCO23378.1 Alpha-acetolactate decarboxylase [Maridesulfovibrio hydrothermalis AM13 = DSM 14728]
MNNISNLLRLFVVASILILCSFSLSLADGVLYQYSTIDSLLLGNYDGELTVDQLKKHGNTGLGTFNKLDGEMVFIDGDVYKVRADGKAVLMPATASTPFAAAVFFKTDSILKIDSAKSLKDLNNIISKALSSENIFYAIRIDGKFKSMRTRSVPAQKKPYPPLVEVVKEQSIFKFSQIEGSLIGLKSPGYVKGIGVPGFHWHFITKDRTAGGHVLDCSFKNITAKVGSYTDFYLQLPQTANFLEADLLKDKEKDLKAVENNPKSD